MKMKEKITSNEKGIHFTARWTTTGKEQRFLAAVDAMFRIKREIKHTKHSFHRICHTFFDGFFYVEW